MTPLKDDNFPSIKRDLIVRIEEAITKIDDIHEEIVEHRKIIKGDPINKVRGVVERLNTIEDAHDKRDKLGLVIATAVIGLIVKNIMDFFTHSK